MNQTQADVNAKALFAWLYEPSHVQLLGVALSELLQQHFSDIQNNPNTFQPWRPPQQLLAELTQLTRSIADGAEPAFLAEPAAALSGANSSDSTAAFHPAPAAWLPRLLTLARGYLERTHRLHSPHYAGHQVPPAIPLAGLFDMLGAVTNQPMAIFEMGPAATAIERLLVRELGQAIGWQHDRWDGIVTHGGTLANITALLTARNRRYPLVWEQGFDSPAPTAADHSTGRPAILASADVHYCITRAAGILGIGSKQVVPIPLDEHRRADYRQLRSTFDRAKAVGLDPFCLVGNAGSTPVGAFDALTPLGAFARDYGLWFHVDGAHGASYLLSNRRQELLAGIETADSLTWDAHKMLAVPALCTFLFYRERHDSYQTFQQYAPYLLSDQPQAWADADFDGGSRTFECTKRAMTLGLWSLWGLLGPQFFSRLLDRFDQLSQQFVTLLQDRSEFQLVQPPQCNIICFRYLPTWLRPLSESKISQVQMELRHRLVQAGEFYITATRLDGAAVLRVVFLHPLQSLEQQRKLLDQIQHIGATLQQ